MLQSAENNAILIKLIKLSVIFNLIKDGWDIINVDKNSIEIKKKREKDDDIDLEWFMNKYLICAFS